MNRDTGIDIALQMRREQEASVNPTVSQLPVKGNQLNDIKATSKGLGVDASGLLAQPEMLPNAKQSLALKNITGKSPELGMYLSEPDKQATWWDKLQDIEKYSTPLDFLHPAGLVKQASKYLFNEDEKKHIASSQAGRALGMADFSVQSTKTYLQESGIAKVMDNPVFKTLFNSDVNLTIQNTQDKIVETKAQMKAGLLKDPNLLVRTTDGIATALSYFGVGYLTGGQGIIPMGVAEGGGMGVEAGRDAGLSDTDQTKLGVTMGAITSLSERASFGFGKYLGASSVGQTVLRNAVARNTAKLLGSGAVEMTEENLEGFGHAESQQMFGMDAEFAFETDPAIFLTGMFMHAGHRIAQTAKRSQVANQLSSHIDSSIAFADKLNVNIEGALSDMINARDKGLTLTFDAIELDVALEKDADLRARVVNLVGEQNYNDKLARGDKIEVTLGDYVEYLRDGDSVLRGVAEYENTKLNATMSEQAQEKALTDLMSYADMQMFVAQTMSDGVAETKTYTKLYDTFVSRMRDSGAYDGRTDIQHTHADFFARLASQFTDMAQRQFDLGTDENKGDFDSVAFIQDLLPMFESGVSAGAQGREIITAMNSMFAENRTSDEVSKGIGARQFLASRGMDGASSNEELLKSFQALVGAGYLKDTANEQDAISMVQTAMESNSLLPEGSKGLEIYQEMGKYLERLEKLGVEVNQRYAQLFESLKTSDPTMSTETLNQLIVEFNNLHGLRERQIVEIQMGGREKALKTFTDMFQSGKTELTYDRWIRVRTPRFKAWFGDWQTDPKNASKVINPRTGEPLVIYHGSEKSFTFREFSKGFARKSTGFYASDSSEVSGTYTVGGAVPLEAFPKGDEAIHFNNDANLYAGFLNLRDAGEYDFKGNSWHQYEAIEEYVPMFSRMGSINDFFNKIPNFTDSDSATEWLTSEIESRLTVIDNTGLLLTNGYGETTGFRPNAIGIRTDGGGVKFSKFMPNMRVEDVVETIKQHSKALAIDAVKLHFVVGDRSTTKVTDQLKDEDFAMGRDGTIMRNVIDTADGSQVASNVFVFFESNQFKHVDNNGAYSDKGDILRQMVRDDFRMEFVEAEARIGGREAWLKADTILHYPEWVASHTVNYKDGMPSVMNPLDTLYQKSEKDFGSMMFVNPVIREINNLPPKQFGKGDEEVATAKQWLDKLKSMPLNKDFMARTKILEHLQNSEGKFSKDKIITMLGNNWGVTLDMVVNGSYNINPMRLPVIIEEGKEPEVTYEDWSSLNPETFQQMNELYHQAIAKATGSTVEEVKFAINYIETMAGLEYHLGNDAGLYVAIDRPYVSAGKDVVVHIPNNLRTKDGLKVVDSRDSDGDVIFKDENGKHVDVSIVQNDRGMSSSNIADVQRIIEELGAEDIIYIDNGGNSVFVFLDEERPRQIETAFKLGKIKNTSRAQLAALGETKLDSGASLNVNTLSHEMAYPLARAYALGEAPYKVPNKSDFSEHMSRPISRFIEHARKQKVMTYAYELAQAMKAMVEQQDDGLYEMASMFLPQMKYLGVSHVSTIEEVKTIFSKVHGEIGDLAYEYVAFRASMDGSIDNPSTRRLVEKYRNKHYGEMISAQTIARDMVALNVLSEPERMSQDEYAEQEGFDDWDDFVRSLYDEAYGEALESAKEVFDDDYSERADSYADMDYQTAKDSFEVENPSDEDADSGQWTFTNDLGMEYSISFERNEVGEDAEGNSIYEWVLDVEGSLYHGNSRHFSDIEGYSADSFEEAQARIDEKLDEISEAMADIAHQQARANYEEDEEWYVMSGFRSEEEAVFAHTDESEIMSEAEDKAMKQYKAHSGIDQERAMQVKWDDYTDSAKGSDPTKTASFNIALRVPKMPSKYRYSSHASAFDGYEENIICLVMGNFRDFVAPDGSTVHAMFIEEVQSDIQQQNREYWQYKKDPAKAITAKAHALPYTVIDWSSLSDVQFELMQKAFERYNVLVDEGIKNANAGGDEYSLQRYARSDQARMILKIAIEEVVESDVDKYLPAYQGGSEILGKTDEFKRVADYLRRAEGSVDIKKLKDITKRANTDLVTNGTEDFYYVTQDNMPQEMMVKAIIQAMANPSFITSPKPVTHVVFGSARTVSIHNQSGQYTDELAVTVSGESIYVNGRNSTDLNGISSYVGTDLVPVVEKYYLLGMEKREQIVIRFKRGLAPEEVGKLSASGDEYLEDIGFSYDITPVMQPTLPNNIGLINQYDKKNPKVIKAEVARMGGKVEEFRAVSNYTVARMGSEELSLNDIPLIGYELKPVQEKWSADPDAVRASLFQRDTLIEGAYNRQTRLLQIFNKDNASTMMHEGAHWYLDTLSVMANEVGLKEAQEAIALIGREFKFNPKLPVGVEAHERFARSFEQFLLEGKAPSMATALTMGEMKEQFKRQYMLAKKAGDISPEARELFSKMIDADEATAEQMAKPLFTAENAEMLGLTEPQLRAYLRNKQMELEESAGNTREKSMSIIEKRKKGQWKRDFHQQKQILLDEMSRNDMDYRDEKIFAYLTKGTMPNGGDVGIPHIRLSRKETVKLIGEEATASFPQNIFGTTQGIPPVSPEDDMLLSMFGYANAQELFDSIEQGIGYQGRVVAQAHAMADQLAEEESASLKAMAEAGAHHSKRAMNLKLEIDVLSRAMNAKPPSMSVISSAVALEVQNMTLEQITKQRNRVLKAERKAGDEALKFMAKGDIPSVINEKIKELTNAVMFDQMVKAQEVGNKQSKWIRDKAKPKSYTKIGKGGAVYVDAYESVLSYIGLTDKANTKPMASVVKELVANGEIVQASDTLIDAISFGEVKFVDQMSVAEVSEIYDLFRNIRSMSSQASTIMVGNEAIEMELVTSEIARNTFDNLTGKPVPLDPETMTALEKGNSYRKQAIADLYRLEAVAGWIDGENAQGMFTSAIWNPFTRASADKNEILRELLEPLASMSEKLINDIGKSSMRKQHTMPWADQNGAPVKVTRQWMISFALNTGNASSLERLGNQFDQSQINHVLSELSETELEYVQNVWDLLETLWTRIETLERKMSGVSPVKVERVPRIIRLKSGEIVKLQGGYFPIVYDKDSAQYIDTFGNEADQLLSKGVMPASTSHGFTKSRAKTVDIPLKFDLTKIMGHIEEVAHDLSHREAVKNAWRIMNSKLVKEAFVGTGNIAMYQMIRAKIKQIAQSDSMDVQGLTAMKKLSRHLRSGISASAMGLSTVTMTKQVIGVSQGIARLGLASDSPIDGFKYMAVGVADSLSRGHREQAIAESGLMKNRIDTVNLDVRRQMTRRMGRTMSLGLVSDMASPLLWLKDRAFVPMAWVQFNFVDMPVYLGAKRLGARQGLQGEELVRFAEGAVRRSQGAGETKDTALIENVAFLELFIPFYSYASAYLNEQITILKKAGKAKQAKRLMIEAPTIATATVMLVMLPMVLDTLISFGLGKMDLPDDDDEEDYWKTLLKYFSIKFTFDAMTYGIPVVRDVGAMTARALNDEPQFSNPRGMDVVAGNLQKLYKHAGDAVSEDEEVDGGKLAKDVVTTTTVLTGIPLNKPYAHLDSYLYELENGDGEFGSSEFWLNFYGGSRNDRDEEK